MQKHLLDLMGLGAKTRVAFDIMCDPCLVSPLLQTKAFVDIFNPRGRVPLKSLEPQGALLFWLVTSHQF